ncbi:YraN family protein [Dyella sp.]|uniref:YraN family protein n=1 Tax=Dyella sp. TaxID=1869338 RepID=UPI002D79F863|nr:YraN family protein [Dyella sp.]HET7331672.1 YraN family protein [Dyella sp.]
MRAAGNAFEQRACDELERAGLKLLARNYTTRYGELDLVMRDRDTIVFVEVRHRVRASHGDAATSVTTSKQAKLIRAAELWLASHPQHAQRPCRFDVVSYDGPVTQAHMTWLRNAFEAD